MVTQPWDESVLCDSWVIQGKSNKGRERKRLSKEKFSPANMFTYKETEKKGGVGWDCEEEADSVGFLRFLHMPGDLWC